MTIVRTAKLPRTLVVQYGIGFVLSIFLFVGSLSGQSQSSAPASQSAGNRQTAPADASGDELRKEAQNPIASLISVPLQHNANFGIEPGQRTQDVLNIQPVIPVGVGKDWNLIVRWITPISWQPLPASPPAPEVGKYGFGDMQPSFFLSPKRTGKLIWGAGPVFQFPTATDTYLGQGKLGLGPNSCGTDPARSLDHWSTGEQYLVGGRFRWTTRCQSDDVAVLHQLQPEKRLVSRDTAYPHCQLGSHQW